MAHCRRAACAWLLATALLPAHAGEARAALPVIEPATPPPTINPSANAEMKQAGGAKHDNRRGA